MAAAAAGPRRGGGGGILRLFGERAGLEEVSRRARFVQHLPVLLNPWHGRARFGGPFLDFLSRQELLVLAQLNLGMALQQAGELVAAEEHFTNAIGKTSSLNRFSLLVREMLSNDEGSSKKAAQDMVNELGGGQIQDVDSLLELGQTLEHQEDLDGARLYYERALMLDPDDENVHFLLGRTYLMQEDRDLAGRHLMTAYQGGLRSCELLCLIGRLMLGGENNDLEGAEKYIRECLDADPENAEALHVIREILSARADVDAMAAKELRLRQRVHQDPLDGNASLALGQLLAGTPPHMQSALYHLNKALDASSATDSVEAHLCLARLVIASRDQLDEAERHFKAALALDDQCLEAYLGLATLSHQHWGDSQSAESYCDTALAKLTSKDKKAAVHHELAKLIQCDSRRLVAASIHFQKCLEYSPEDTNPAVLMDYAKFLRRFDNNDRKIQQQYWKVLQRGERNPDERLRPLHKQLAAALHATAPAAALAHYRAAAAAEPGDAAVRLNLARVLGTLRRTEEAAAEYRAALALAPRDPFPARYGLARLLHQRGAAPALALPHYRAALAARPGHRDARLSLAALLKLLGDAPGAAREYAAVLRTGPGDAAAHAGLADALARQGERRAAVFHLRACLAADPFHLRAKRRLERLLREGGGEGRRPPGAELELKEGAVRAGDGGGLGDMASAVEGVLGVRDGREERNSAALVSSASHVDKCSPSPYAPVKGGMNISADPDEVRDQVVPAPGQNGKGSPKRRGQVVPSASGLKDRMDHSRGQKSNIGGSLTKRKKKTWLEDALEDDEEDDDDDHVI